MVDDEIKRKCRKRNEGPEQGGHYVAIERAVGLYGG